MEVRVASNLVESKVSISDESLQGQLCGLEEFHKSQRSHQAISAPQRHPISKRHAIPSHGRLDWQGDALAPIPLRTLTHQQSLLKIDIGNHQVHRQQYHFPPKPVEGKGKLFEKWWSSLLRRNTETRNPCSRSREMCSHQIQMTSISTSN